MLTDSLVKHLRSENEYLQVQLQDLNEMIQVREEELEILRKTVGHAASLQSKLDMNLDEFYQMQDRIQQQEIKARGAVKREASLEDELMKSIEIETAFYNMRDEFSSTKAALTDVSKEADQVATLYQEISTLKRKIAELESNLEIATLENGFLKEEVDQYRAMGSMPKK